MSVTLVSVLLDAGGLSIHEAAGYLNSRPDTVKSWASGRRTTPPKVFVELTDLVKLVHTSARQHINALPEGATLVIRTTADKKKAVALGWPGIGTHRLVLGLMAALAIEKGHPISVKEL